MKLGDLTVGIIVENEEFRKQIGALVSFLDKTQRDLNNITSQQAKTTGKIITEQQKATTDQTKTSRIALQQQYYQVSSLRRLSLVVAGLTATMTLFGKKAVESFMNFEQKMADARAAAQATEGQFAKMTELALKLGRSTIFSAQEAAEGMELLAKAGYQASDVMKALDGSMLLAGATGEDLAGGVALLVAVLHQFEIATENSSEVANTLAGGAQFSLATVQNLGQGLKFVGSTAHQFSISLGETVTALAALSNAGIRMQMSGRLLSSGLQTLNANNAAVNKGLTMLGIKFDEVAPATHTLTQIIGRFEKAQRDLGDAQKYSAAMTTLFGKESSRVIIPLVTMGEKAFGEFLKRIEATGNAEAMMIMRTDTLRYALKELSNVFQNIMISIGRASGEGGLKTFVQGMTELLRSIESGNQGLLKLIGNIMPYVVAVGIATTATVGLAAGVATLSLAINELHAASAATSLGFLSTLVTLPNVLIGMALLAGVVAVLVANIQRMGDTLENTVKKFKKANLELEISRFTGESLLTNWKKLNEELKKLTPGTEEYTEKKKQELSIASQLIDLYPELLGLIDQERVSLQKVNEVIDQSIQKKKEQVDLIRNDILEVYKKEIESMERLLKRGYILTFTPTFQYIGLTMTDRTQIEKYIDDTKKAMDDYGRGVFKEMKAYETPVVEAKPFEWSDKSWKLYQDIISDINKLTLNRYQIERSEAQKTYRELVGYEDELGKHHKGRIEEELEADKESTDTQKEQMKKRLDDVAYKSYQLKLMKIDEDRLEKVKELLQKEQYEMEKAGLEGLALRRAQANQEFEQDKVDWDKRIKEGEVGWAEYAQAMIFGRQRLVAELSKIDKDEGEIYKKVQAEILGLEAQAKIQRATGRERELLEIEESRRKDLADLEEKKAKEPELTEQYRREEELINQKYDQERQDALAKLGPLQEMVLTKVIDSMVDLVAITKDWGEYFKNVIQQLMMDLVKFAVKIALVQMAANILGKSASIIGGIVGLPTGIFGAGGLFKPAMGMPAPAMAGMPALPKLAPAPPPMNFGYPVVNNRTSREIKVFSTINIQGDVLDMDNFYRKKILPAQQRFFGKRFE